jgi:hypothetical protein
VLIDTWPKEDSAKIYSTVIVEHAKNSGYSVHAADITDTDMLVVIDEAQMSYYDSGLWLGLIKTQSGKKHGLRICLFVCYGSVKSGPEDYAFGFGTTLAQFGNQQRVSIIKSGLPFSPPISLFYTRHEFEDAVRRTCKKKSLQLNDDAINYVFSLSNGHPGAVDGILGMIQMVCLKPLYKDPDLSNYIYRLTTMRSSIG